LTGLARVGGFCPRPNALIVEGKDKSFVQDFPFGCSFVDAPLIARRGGEFLQYLFGGEGDDDLRTLSLVGIRLCGALFFLSVVVTEVALSWSFLDMKDMAS
jgi:hypothetical protein